MIAVTFALPAESSAFVRSLKGVKRDGALLSGNIEYRTPNVEHRALQLCVLHTGVGKTKCAERVENFLRTKKPELFIASGFCGATNDELQPGDLVIAGNASEPDRLQKAREILSDAKVGKIHSADRVVDPAADRYAIGREHGAIAVDMETETIARLCAAESIPMLALRVVSDSPAAPFPAPPNVLFDIQKQRINFSLLLSYIARNPVSALHLVQFSKQIACAKTKLADALIALLQRL
jgi:nucleoside phosphorylase